MGQQRFIITGINKLTHQREQISGPMAEEAAKERLQREIANRKFQRYQTHARLKVERLEAVQLSLNFPDYD